MGDIFPHWTNSVSRTPKRHARTIPVYGVRPEAPFTYQRLATKNLARTCFCGHDKLRHNLRPSPGLQNRELSREQARGWVDGLFWRFRPVDGPPWDVQFIIAQSTKALAHMAF